MSTPMKESKGINPMECELPRPKVPPALLAEAQALELEDMVRVDGKAGVYRSDNGGGVWVRINDDRHQYAWTGNKEVGTGKMMITASNEHKRMVV